MLGVAAMALEPGVALPTLLPSLLRALQALALAMPACKPDGPLAARRSRSRCSAATRSTMRLAPALTADIEPPYAWYVRVPDLPRFIRRIAPALERRLAESSAWPATPAS